jgi:arabinofuranosyltransferase
MFARSSAAWLWLLLALLPCCAYLGVELYLLDGRPGLPLDDGFIHLQFARNLAAGDGLSYNRGELVTGSTSPLWTALLSLGFLVDLPPLAWGKALGVFWHLLTLVATFALGRELGAPRWLAGLAVGLAASTSWLVWSSLSAMEVPLFTALSVAGIARHVRERREPEALPIALPLFGLGVLARPEGLLLLALAAADSAFRVVRREGSLVLVAPPWRRLFQGLLLAALVAVPTMLVYRAIGGSALPSTFSTKAGYSVPGLPEVRYLFLVLQIFVSGQPVAAILAPAGVLMMLRRLGDDEDRGLLAPLWLAGLPLAYATLSGAGKGIYGNFGRYFFPLFPVVVVFACLAVLPLVGQVPTTLRLGRLRVFWPLWLGLLLLLPTGSALVAGGDRYGRNVLDIDLGDVRLARELSTALPPEAVLAVNDIGALKFYLPNRVLDLAGIASPELHGYVQRSIAETGSLCAGVLTFLRERQPDYLAIFPGWYPCVTAEEFPLVVELRVPGNITLGEDHIVLLATPWTRFPLHHIPGSDPAAAGSPEPARYPAPPATGDPRGDEETP